MDPFDMEPTPEERQAALIQALKMQIGGGQQPEQADVYRAWGNLGQLSGDRVLAPFGQNQVQQAAQMDGQGSRLLGLLARQRVGVAKTPEELEAISARAAYERAKAAGLRNPAEKPAKDTSFKDAETLRKELNGSPVTKAAQDAAVAWEKIQASAKDPSAAGDLALIFNFMKTLDPGSTVREGEFANAQNAGGVDDRIVSQYNRVRSGERLAPEQRADFLRRAGEAFSAHVSRQKKLADQYSGVAKRRGVNPEDVALDLGFGPVSAEPETKVIDGKTYFKNKNGKWAVKE